MNHQCATRLLRLAVALVFLLPPAVTRAAAPSNDDWWDATVVSDLPFQETIDVSAATSAPDDPYCDGDLRTVWYTYTPTTDVRIVATAWGDHYDTTLSVYTSPPSDKTQLLCNDDYTGGFGSRVIFDASAGTPYYFMIADTEIYPATSWMLSFTMGVSPPPPTIDYTIDSVALDADTGQVTLTGTTTCTNGVSAAMYLDLQQKGGKSLIEDDESLAFGCVADMPWSVVFASDAGSFKHGQATLTGWAMACNCQIGECDSDDVECAVEEIELKLKLNK